MSLSDTEKKERARWQRILRVYGITKEQYMELDKGYCPICLKHWDDRTRPCVDHDHTTGDIRGILCLYCNRYRVGNFRDPDLVYRIYEYLASPRKGWIAPKKKRQKKKKRKA